MFSRNCLHSWSQATHVTLTFGLVNLKHMDSCSHQDQSACEIYKLFDIKQFSR